MSQFVIRVVVVIGALEQLPVDNLLELAEQSERHLVLKEFGVVVLYLANSLIVNLRLLLEDFFGMEEHALGFFDLSRSL